MTGGSGTEHAEAAALDHLVLRYSSLGDVVLAASITGALGRVGFVTGPAYQELVARFPGVVAVFGPEDTLPAEVPLIDLHHNLRSARVRASARVERQDWRRWAHVWFKGPPADRVIDRYARAAGVTPAPAPWLAPVERGDTLLIAPGAAHATKRWPYWRALAAAWPGPVRALGGPADADRVREIGGVWETGFTKTITAMNGGAVLVAGDSGLLHLGAAVGLPVVGVFGPTTSADGFWCHRGEVVELPLACRPCSKYGGPTCPMGDHACMRGISVEQVLAACLRVARLPG